MKIIDKLKKEIPSYIHNIEHKNSEQAKSMMFSQFLTKCFDIKPEELDYEVPTSSTVLQVRGRIDVTFGALIIEFKKDLKKQLEEARTGLKKYFQAYLEKSEEGFLGIATDGVLFAVFVPITEKSEVIELKTINTLDMKNADIEEIFLWFDSLFFAETKIIPSSKDIKHRFGLESPTFFAVCNELEKLFAKLEFHGDTPALMKYNSWSKYLEIVYGDKPKDKTLFFKHTYLSTLVKLIIDVKITKGKPNSFDEIMPILHGNKFKNAGITNFIEDDFYAWVLRPYVRKQTSKLFYNLLKEVYVYDLEKLNEDVLKGLYQELIDTEIKQSLGEFYTPDWLATTMVKNTLIDNIECRVLDPSCGSGTFLFKIIKFKYEKLLKKGWSKTNILEHILENVVGFDVHPLAVMIARTNYLLSLGDLLHSKQDSISIPIYLSDSLKIPRKQIEISSGIEISIFEAVDKTFEFPIRILENITNMDKIMELMKANGSDYELKIERGNFTIAEEYKQNTIASFKNALVFNYGCSKEESIILGESLNTLYKLIDSGMDSVWPYILRNMYKPISMTLKKADVILGNPPWITLRNIKNAKYQKFIKDHSRFYKLNTEAKLAPHIEISTLFFCHVSDQYLKNNGKIGFIMPRSVMVSTNHEKFLKFSKPKMKLEQIYDLEKSKDFKVVPLFKIPSCVIFCSKNQETKYPVSVKEFEGKLSTFNSQIEESSKSLKTTISRFRPLDNDRSQYGFYHDKFTQGATIVPNPIWWIEIVNDDQLGINPKCPHIKTLDNPDTHKKWKHVVMDGVVETDFLFYTIPSKMIVPFGVIGQQLIILPIVKNESDDNFKMIKKHDDEEIETKHISNYLKMAEKHWMENATEKSRKNTLYQYVNYRNKIIIQTPYHQFKVVYVAYGTYMAACVVDTTNEYIFTTGKTKMRIKRFFADATTYWFDTDSIEEAYYLIAVLNSNHINEKMKPYQPTGKFGTWAIHRIPIRFQIPKFDSGNSKHIELSSLGKMATKKTGELVKKMNLQKTKPRKIGKSRTEIRNNLSIIYKHIDEIVQEILED